MIRRALPVAAALFFALAAAAQTRLYDRSLRDYPWLDGTNAAAPLALGALALGLVAAGRVSRSKE